MADRSKKCVSNDRDYYFVFMVVVFLLTVLDFLNFNKGNIIYIFTVYCLCVCKLFAATFYIEIFKSYIIIYIWHYSFFFMNVSNWNINISTSLYDISQCIIVDILAKGIEGVMTNSK